MDRVPPAPLRILQGPPGPKGEDGGLLTEAEIQHMLEYQIAQEPTVVAAAAAAVDANPTIADHETRISTNTAKANRADTRVFDVRAFGVVPDDSAAAAANGANLDTLLSAVAAIGGGTITFTDGEWWTDRAFAVPSGVTVQGTGRRKSRIRTNSLTANGLEIVGTANTGVSHRVQVTIRDLGIVGPGKTSGGTGVGIRLKWASVGIEFERLWIVGWGSHGVSAEDAYSMTWKTCLFDSNGGDGWFGQTNINNTTWANCISILNNGRGYAIVGGTTGYFENSDAELNQGAGWDLRYCYTYVIKGHMEQNGHDGVSPNIYIGQRNAGEGCNSVSIQHSQIQGSAVTGKGIVVEQGNMTLIGPGNEFAGHITSDIEIGTASRRTVIQTNGGTANPTIVDNDTSRTTAILAYDYANLIMQVSPALRFAPKTTAPIIAAEGNVWADSTNKVLKYYDGARARIFAAYIEGSASLAAVSIPAQSTVDLTITLAGATAGDGVLVIPPGNVLPVGVNVGAAWVSAADTVKIRLHNVTAGALNSTTVTAGWKVKVYKG